MEHLVVYKAVKYPGKVSTLKNDGTATIIDIKNEFFADAQSIEMVALPEEYTRKKIVIIVGVYYDFNDEAKNFRYAKDNEPFSGDHNIYGQCVFARFIGAKVETLDKDDLNAISKFYSDMNDEPLFPKVDLKKKYFDPDLIIAILNVGLIYWQRARNKGNNDYDDWYSKMVDKGTDKVKVYLPAIYAGIQAYPLTITYNEDVMKAFFTYVFDSLNKGDDYEDTYCQLLRKYGEYYIGYLNVVMATTNGLQDACIAEIMQ